MDEENFKVKMELDTDQFYKDLDKIESVTKDLDKNPKRISLFVDKKDFDKQTREAFDAFDKMALRNSKVNMARSLFGNKNEYYAYARIFNDIRANAMDALRNISNEGRKLQLKVETNNITDAKDKLSELENQLQELQTKSNNYSWLDMNKDQMTDALNQAIKERKVLSGKRLTPTRLGQDDIAQQYTQQINELTTRINQMRDKLSGGLGVSKEELNSYEKLKQEIAQVTQMITQLKAQIGTGSVVSEEDNAKLQQLRQSYDAILEDLKKNPLYVQLTSQELSKQNKHNKEILSHYRGINKEARKMTMFSRITSSMFTRMRFQIVSWLNPFNRAKDIWQEFTSQNKIVGNTFSMIGKNFVRIITPLLMKLTQTLVNLAGYADKFLIGLQKAFGVIKPISLFDKDGLIEAERIWNSMNDAQASFDELHPMTNITDLERWGTLTPTLEPGWENNFEKWGEKAGEIFGWAMEHPLLTALGLIFGPMLLKLLGSALLKGLGWLGGKLFGGLFGGSAAKAAVTGGASTLGSLFGKIFGKTITAGSGPFAINTTLGKLLGFGIPAAVSGAMAISTAKDAGTNWEDMNGGEKAWSAAKTVGFSAGAGILGALALGSNPLGWAIGAGVLLTSVAVGLSQVQDGLGDVDEEAKKLEEMQANYQNALNDTRSAQTNTMNAMSQLKTLEEQTGLSGQALADAVDAGTLSIDQMTASQYQVYSAYMQANQAIREQERAQRESNKAARENAEQSIDSATAVAKESKEYDKLAEEITYCWQQGTIDTETARDKISRAMASMDEQSRQTFLEHLPAYLQEGLDYEKYQSGWNDVGRFFENMWTGIVGVWDQSFANMEATQQSYMESLDALKAKQSELEQSRQTLSDAEKAAGMTYDELSEKIKNGEIDVTNLTTAQKNLLDAYQETMNKEAEVRQSIEVTGEQVVGLARKSYDTSKDWKAFIDELVRANQEGELSTEDMSREIGVFLGDVDRDTSELATNYVENLGLMTDEVKRATDEQNGFFEDWWRNLSGWFSDIGQKFRNLFGGNGFKTDKDIQIEATEKAVQEINNDPSLSEEQKRKKIQDLYNAVPKYDVGTPFVPNDQLAMVHRGEAIIPAKYNKVYGQMNSSADNSMLYQTIDNMNAEIGELRSLIQQGIPVTGQFVQRGNDLYATVEKAKSRRGTQPLSNAAYAR